MANMVPVTLDEANRHIDRLLIESLPREFRQQVQLRYDYIARYIDEHNLSWQDIYTIAQKVDLMPENENLTAANETVPLAVARLEHSLGDQSAAYSVNWLYVLHSAATKLFLEIAGEHRNRTSGSNVVQIDRQRRRSVNFIETLEAFELTPEVAKQAAKKFETEANIFLDQRAGISVSNQRQ